MSQADKFSCTHEEAALAVYDELKAQISFLVETLEQYAMIASPMGEIARTALTVYAMPRDKQRRSMSVISLELSHINNRGKSAKLAADAKRYRWIRKLPDGFSIRMNIGHDWELLAEEDLDVAIDNAIAAFNAAF